MHGGLSLNYEDAPLHQIVLKQPPTQTSFGGFSVFRHLGEGLMSTRAAITFATIDWLKFLHEVGISIQAFGRYEVGNDLHIDFKVGGNEIFRVKRPDCNCVPSSLRLFTNELDKYQEEKRKQRELVSV